MTGEGSLRVVSLMALMLALGLLSGLVPLINAEALLIAAVLQTQWQWPAVVVAIALGQSGAKVLIFLGARDGRRLMGFRRGAGGTTSAWWPARLRRSPAARPPGPTRWWSSHADRVAELVRRPVAGSLLILASAIGGIPPLAATSVVAGMARMRLTLFGATCLGGRLIRFTLIAIPVAGWPYLAS